MQWFPLLQILLIVLAGFFPGGRVSAADAFTNSVTQIREASLAGLGEAVDSLARLEDARVIGLLEHLLEGRLYARKADGVLVYAEAVAEGMATVSVLDGTPQGLNNRT